MGHLHAVQGPKVLLNGKKNGKKIEGLGIRSWKLGFLLYNMLKIEKEPHTSKLPKHAALDDGGGDPP